MPNLSEASLRLVESETARGILSLSLSKSKEGRSSPTHSMHLASSVVHADRNSDCEETNISNLLSILPAASATPLFASILAADSRSCCSSAAISGHSA